MKTTILFFTVLFLLFSGRMVAQNFSLEDPENILSRNEKEAIENAITYQTAFFNRIFNQTVDFSEIQITIMPNFVSCMLYQSQIGIHPPRRSSGFYMPSRRELVICKDKKFRHAFLRTAFHEISHAFIHLHAGNNYVPIWLNEGLAVYLESMTFSSRRIRHTVNRHRLAQLRTFIELREVNLAEFVNWSHQRFYNESFSQAGIGYVKAYAMVLFLLRQQDKERTFTIFRNLIGENSTIAVFDKYYEGGFAQFERDFMAYFSRSNIR